MENRLILGDNLQILKTMPSESVDLCYIDPPFFSNRNYEMVWGDDGEIRSFEDRWSGGIDHYIGWLKERIGEIWHVLKPTGSLYVHCDRHADAYIRVYILDRLGGKFVNEIAWCYSRPTTPKIMHFPNEHDTIFLYAKSQNKTFNKDDIMVRYKSGIHASRTTAKAAFGNAKTLEDAQKAEERGKLPEDWWTDIYTVDRMRSERIGYPTQKPLALLERIIKASSNEGDVVLDAFCGGGTTLVAAQRLGRKFIGIDQSEQAIAISRKRLENDLPCSSFSVETFK
jgi:DNA modification methylase